MVGAGALDSPFHLNDFIRVVVGADPYRILDTPLQLNDFSRVVVGADPYRRLPSSSHIAKRYIILPFFYR